MSKKPSDLTAATALSRADLFHVVQGGNSRKATVGDIQNLLPVFGARNAANAALAAALDDDTIIQMGGLLYIVDSSLGVNDSATKDLSVAGLAPFGQAHIEQFGGVGDNSTDNSAAMTQAIAVCAARGIGTLRFGDGDFVFSSQVHITAGSGTVLRLSIIGNGIVNTTVKLNVTGSVAGYDVAGFGWVFDGWSDSQVSDMRIDASGGTAGIALQCRNQGTYYANFGPNLEIRGGTDLADRETTTNIAVRLIGNRSGDTTSYGILYNRFMGVRFTTAYKLVEHIVADGDPSTKFPNECKFIACNFDRYIIALDWGDSDEHTLVGGFFNNAAGVVGINGGFTHCIVTNGSLNQVWTGAEPGNNSKPFSLGADAESNHFFLASNCTSAGDNVATAKTNVIFDRTSLDGVADINALASNSDGETTINFFGDGTNSHQGTGLQKLQIWARNGNTDRIAIGYSTTNVGTIDVPSGDTLELDAGTGTVLLDCGTVQSDAATVSLTHASPKVAVTSGNTLELEAGTGTILLDADTVSTDAASITLTHATPKISVTAGNTIELEAGAAGTILLDADTFETDAAAIRLSGATTQATVGSAGGAAALPATPTGYLVLNIGGTDRAIPYFDVS